MTEVAEPVTSPSPTPSPPLLRPRREPFEHGLLPIPKIIFADGAATLSSVKQKLISSDRRRVGSLEISESLGISSDDARLVLESLSAVLPSDSDPLASARTEDVDAVGAHVDDLILFLYIQSYKRLLPRSHKDSASVADVWPSTSAFDGYLSALSPLQLVRSNSRRFMPSQADEEAHQLSYLQKHIANMLALLADPVESNDEESLVLTLERFEHLGFLIQFGEKGSEGIPLSQVAPFFANSDPDMPAAPVPAGEVHEWLLQNIAASLEQTAEKVAAKENGPQNASDSDVTMVDVYPNQGKGQSSLSLSGASIQGNSRNQTFVEGISRASVVKKASDIKGSSVKVVNCHDSVVYILAPLRYATIYGCSDATIVLGAIGKAVRVEHCERVQVITAAKRICIANCRECVFFLGVNQRPLVLGDNHKLKVAPYNTFYSQLEEHMTKVGVDGTVNRWDEPFVLGMVDPHDSLSHPAGVSEVQAESATYLDPDQFTNFLIPDWLGGTSNRRNPDVFKLPEKYMESQKKNKTIFDNVQQALRDVQLEDNRKRELASALHAHFKDWLYASGNIRQLYCLQGD
ncbi:hypothetical protein QJS04_geneDACA016326 [Acorus gramineus]|uniref:TBCC domain-containing protein 1 n=1 Tax=Acorus gramineus TaxID=55184 RepID=A0AAV9ARJ6_ACOGR|nr:hypothetical protein QJS04_geneDACA016326 [Acorus gramineus]